MIIQEYQLSRRDAIETIAMPTDAFILGVGKVDGKLVVWASTGGSDELKNRTFELALTNRVTDDAPRFFLGTVQFDYPLHIFERLS